MKDDADSVSPADSADEAMTDEDLWNEIESEDTGHDPDAVPEDRGDTDPEEDAAPEDDGATKTEETTPKRDTAEMSVDDLRAQTERLMQQLNSEQGRATGQQRRADKLQKELEELRATLAAKGSGDDSERRERLQRTAEEYGDVVNPVLEEVNALRDRVDQLTNSERRRLTDLEGQMTDLVRGETARFHEEHPDGFDVLKQNGGLFKEWVQDQPRAVRDAFNANYKQIVDGTSAAYVVGLFKQHLAEARDGGASTSSATRSSAKRSRQMAGAQTMRSPTRQTTTPAPPSDLDDPQAHWDYYERMERKQTAQR